MILTTMRVFKLVLLFSALVCAAGSSSATTSKTSTASPSDSLTPATTKTSSASPRPSPSSSATKSSSASPSGTRSTTSSKSSTTSPSSSWSSRPSAVRPSFSSSQSPMPSRTAMASVKTTSTTSPFQTYSSSATSSTTPTRTTTPSTTATSVSYPELIPFLGISYMNGKQPSETVFSALITAIVIHGAVSALLSLPACCIGQAYTPPNNHDCCRYCCENRNLCLLIFGIIVPEAGIFIMIGFIGLFLNNFLLCAYMRSRKCCKTCQPLPPRIQDPLDLNQCAHCDARVFPKNTSCAESICPKKICDKCVLKMPPYFEGRCNACHDKHQIVISNSGAAAPLEVRIPVSGASV